MVAVSMMAVAWQLPNKETKNNTSIIQHSVKSSVFQKFPESEVRTRSYKLLFNLGVGMCFPTALCFRMHTLRYR